MIEASPEVEELAKTVEDNGGVYFVPAFSGLFAPYWRGDARGVIAGLTRYVNTGHIARAALEATAWQTREVLDAMNADSGVELTELKVDGGMVYNDTADAVPGRRARRAGDPSEGGGDHGARRRLRGGPRRRRSGAPIDDLRANWGKDKEWTPPMDAAERREGVRACWKKAVTRTFDWVE